MALFISDLHLCPSRPATTAAFFDFLAGPARQTDALYILGDLFEYWLGDDDLSAPFNTSVAQALAALSDHGVAVYFMAGNRDFLLGAHFAARAGLSLLNDPCRIILAGTPTLLLHGDSLCTDDAAYQAFRRQARDPAWQSHFLSQPLASRQAQAQALRRQSEAAKGEKMAAIMDVNTDAVTQAFRQQDCVRIIHGHTHRPAQQLIEVDGRPCERWVLADWHDRATWLECDAQGCRAMPYPG